MITVEIGGNRFECETEREARKVMAREARRSRKVERERAERIEWARMKANARAYRVLCAKVECLEEPERKFPRGWVLYTPKDEWFRHLAQAHPDDPYTWRLNTEDADWVEVKTWGQQLVAAVCNGAGFCWLVFLQNTDGSVHACAVAVHDGEWCLSPCPGIQFADFRTSRQERAELDAAMAVTA